MRTDGLRTNAWWIAAAMTLSAFAAPSVAQERPVPPDNVRLVFQLVEADGFTDDDPEIADVVAELRELFRFEGYRLAATGLLNVHPDGYAGTRLTGGELGGYQVEVSLSGVQEMVGRPSRIRIAVNLVHEDYGPAMEAAVTVRNGQTLVLGSTRAHDGEALILIMRTEFR